MIVVFVIPRLPIKKIGSGATEITIAAIVSNFLTGAIPTHLFSFQKQEFKKRYSYLPLPPKIASNNISRSSFPVPDKKTPDASNMSPEITDGRPTPASRASARFI